MATHEKDPTREDMLALYFLSWHDVLERLDTIILEIRHIQKNIIHLLHAPYLYHALKYEQDFLWGDKQNDTEAKDRNSWSEKVKFGNNFATLAEQWVIDFPKISNNYEKPNE